MQASAFSLARALGALVLVLGGAASSDGRADEAPARGLHPAFAAAEARLHALADTLIAIRHDLHRHPELSGAEARTAGIVAARLEALGLAVRRGVGGHGVVGILRGARSGKTVLLRADMDAVQSNAPDPVPYRSLDPGVRHICGHDVHTTVALGVAEALAHVRDRFAGTVLFVFQPAEERATGARAMIDAGAIDDPRPDASFAVHTAPLEVGMMGGTPGTLLAARDRVTITLKGKGDLEAAARDINTRVPSLTSENARDPQGLIVGEFLSTQRFGTARDGDQLIMRSSFQSTGDSVRAAARETLEVWLGALPGGVTGTLHYEARSIPGVWNDPAREARAREVMAHVLGAENLSRSPGVIPGFSEDFGWFLDAAPGAMFWLGVSNTPRGTAGMPHAPDYVADDGALLVGARALSAVLLDALGP